MLPTLRFDGRLVVPKSIRRFLNAERVLGYMFFQTLWAPTAITLFPSPLPRPLMAHPAHPPSAAPLASPPTPLPLGSVGYFVQSLSRRDFGSY